MSKDFEQTHHNGTVSFNSLLAIYSKYGPVLKACETGTFAIIGINTKRVPSLSRWNLCQMEHKYLRRYPRGSPEMKKKDLPTCTVRASNLLGCPVLATE